ncbi:MAG: protease HtpX [Magnetococcales bacterium]|nr:protease HtpX [Magnetococcales bacterium]
MKRITLFIMTNLAILLLLGIVLNMVSSYLGLSHNSIGGILILAAIFGMGGSLISLALSKTMAKWSTGAQIIEQPRNSVERWLMKIVQHQAQQAGIGMPEVAIYNSPDMNAFATGMNRNNALVAVSTGLLEQMNDAEIEAVLAHEVSHIANGDMVTLALIQGVINTFVMVMARLIGGVIDNALFRNNDEEESNNSGFSYMIVVFVLEMIFGLLASIIVMWFSRHREFHADRGGAQLAGRNKMIAALQRLQRERNETQLPQEMSAFGVSGGKALSNLFMTHPPLETRIKALQSQK